MSFQTTPNNSTTRAEAMRIDSTGYVGIGTTTPAYPLSVNGTIQSMTGGFRFPDGTTLATAANVPSTLTNNTYTGNQTITGTVAASGDIDVDSKGLNTGTLSPGLRFGGLTSGEGIASNLSSSSANQYGLDFFTNETPQMSITQSGTVGIATQTPAAQLHVIDSDPSNPTTILGQAVGESATGATQAGYYVGTWGDMGGPSGEGEGVLGTADDNYAGLFANNSSTGGYPALWAENDEAVDSNTPVFITYGNYNNSTNGATCIIDVSANLTCTGSVSGAVGVGSSTAGAAARQVAVHAVQSPENWFEDFGSGTLSAGAATITLDPTFAQTVNTAIPYHVFLTPNGDCKGLYVAQKSATSFEVRELGGGLSNAAFDYRIVAKRLGYENARLEDLTAQFKKQALHRNRVRRLRPSSAASSLQGPAHSVAAQ